MNLWKIHFTPGKLTINQETVGIIPALFFRKRLTTSRLLMSVRIFWKIQMC